MHMNMTTNRAVERGYTSSSSEPDSCLRSVASTSTAPSCFSPFSACAESVPLSVHGVTGDGECAMGAGGEGVRRGGRKKRGGSRNVGQGLGGTSPGRTGAVMECEGGPRQRENHAVWSLPSILVLRVSSRWGHFWTPARRPRGSPLGGFAEV